MYIPILPTLPLSIVFQKKKFSIEEFLGENITTFRYGRDAIWWGLKALNIKKGENVLLPCSVCEAIIQPFLSLNINIKLYQFDKTLNYDIKEIEGKIDRNTRAIYIIHYFGFPRNLLAIRNFCDRKQLYLIEDCAHSFPGKHRGKLLGSYGDVSIFSLRKILPIPDGGSLRINRTVNNTFHIPEARDWSKKSVLEGVKLVLKDLAIRNVIPWKFIKKMGTLLPYNGPPVSIKDNVEDYSYSMEMSYLSKKIMEKLNIEDIVNRRRANYKYWLSNMDLLPNFIPLYPDLPEGVSPYSFPVIVKNRDYLVKKLEREGIFLEPTLNPPFYGLKNLLNKGERFIDTEYLEKRVLSLPVHQSVDLKLLEKIRKKIAKVL